MKNETPVKYFYILPFSGETKNRPLISSFFFLIYVVGVLVNSSIITTICLEVQLHKPMYLFICNLSIADIFCTSVTVPKLLHMLLSGDHIVFISQCYAQLYFAVVTAEDILLFFMAYDRYVAICKPLHYQGILNKKNCILITIGIWAAAFLNALIFVLLTVNMSSCHSNIIHQFFCDAKSLTKTSCTTSQITFIAMGIEILIFVFVPVMCTVISYANIFTVIFNMKTKESRRKTFSTCSSHVIVITIYYVTGVAEYLVSSYSDVLDSVFNIVFSTIIPLINPIIYSMQNAAVQSALLGLVRGICFRQ